MFFRCFVTGGVLGVLGASLLESYLLRPDAWVFLRFGFIEEFAKLAALVWCARHLQVRTLRDGAILGATVGCTGTACSAGAGSPWSACSAWPSWSGSCTAPGCGRQGIGRPSTSVNRSPIDTPNARDSRQRPRMFMPR